MDGGRKKDDMRYVRLLRILAEGCPVFHIHMYICMYDL